MEKNNHKDMSKENRVPRVAIYIRTGNIEQLSSEEEQRGSIIEMVRSQKRECGIEARYGNLITFK